MFSSQFCHVPECPCTRTRGGPWPSSHTLTGRPPTSTQRRCSLQSTSSHSERPWGPYSPSSTPSIFESALRIAVDIDSTLHPYWDQLAEVARRRFGVELPYEDQVTWEIEHLTPQQVAECVAETHTAELVL